MNHTFKEYSKLILTINKIIKLITLFENIVDNILTLLYFNKLQSTNVIAADKIIEK